jgi:hypothetical protein
MKYIPPERRSSPRWRACSLARRPWCGPAQPVWPVSRGRRRSTATVSLKARAGTWPSGSLISPECVTFRRPSGKPGNTTGPGTPGDGRRPGTIAQSSPPVVDCSDQGSVRRAGHWRRGGSRHRQEPRNHTSNPIRRDDPFAIGGFGARWYWPGCLRPVEEHLARMTSRGHHRSDLVGSGVASCCTRRFGYGDLSFMFWHMPLACCNSQRRATDLPIAVSWSRSSSPACVMERRFRWLCPGGAGVSRRDGGPRRAGGRCPVRCARTR